MAQTAFPQLWRMLEQYRPVAVHRHLVGLTRNVHAALLLSQLAYWTRRSPQARALDGWLPKSTDQWFQELGLSRREQETARKRLRRLGVLEQALKGQPPLRYHRLKLPQLGGLITARFELPAVTLDLETFCTDDRLVRELLGGALPYQRELAHLTGSVNAAWLLTRVIFQHRRHLHARGWFRMRLQEVERELGLSRWELETARIRLRDPRFIEERRVFSPPQLYVRAVPDAIRLALHFLETKPTTGDHAFGMSRSGGSPIVGIPAVSDAQKRQTNSRDFRQFVWRKTTSQFGGKPHLSLAENHISYNKEVNLTIEDLTTTTTTVTAVGSQAPRHTDGQVVVVDEAKSEKAQPQSDSRSAGNCPAAGHTEAASIRTNRRDQAPRHCLAVRHAAGAQSCPAAGQLDTTTRSRRSPEGARIELAPAPACPAAGHLDPSPRRSTIGHPRSAEDCPATGQDDLTFPQDFLPAERELARQALAAINPRRRQLILDEIEGRQRKGRRVDSRLSLVRALVDAERAGRFTPAYAWEIRSARERAAQRETERRNREEQARRARQAASRAIAAETEGKTGFEAFKAFAARLRRTRGRPGQAPSNREDSK